MYIATNETRFRHSNIIGIFPPNIRRCLSMVNLDEAQEIKLIRGQPMYIHYCDGDYFLTNKGTLLRENRNGIIINKCDVEYIMEKITKSSLYSVTDELKNGYITISGGHRIGITGTAVMKDEKVEFIKNISAMNIRIANEIIGIADKIIDEIDHNGINNTLIISPPSCGKTTLLRDIARELSQRGYCVGIADERCEIAAMHNGVSGFILGPRSMVMEACPKSYAMECLMRTMAPEVIVTDELGKDEDADAVYNMINAGVSVIATAHGRDIEQLLRRNVYKRLVPMFDVIITLSKQNGVGTVEGVRKND